MSKAININYTLDEQTYLESSYEIYQYEFKNSSKRYIGWFFVALAQFGVVGALKHDVYGILIVSTIGLSYWYIFRWSIRKYFIKKAFYKNENVNKTLNLTIKDDGIYLDDKLQIDFSKVNKVIFLDNAIAIYHQCGVFYIPNKAFQSTKDQNKAKKILEKIV
jgi:hypothetical protein